MTTAALAERFGLWNHVLLLLGEAESELQQSVYGSVRIKLREKISGLYRLIIRNKYEIMPQYNRV